MHLTSEAEGRTEDVPGAILTREKSRRMDREIASEMASFPWGQNNRKENAARTKASTGGPGSF